jgi:hypothetical protein
VGSGTEGANPKWGNPAQFFFDVKQVRGIRLSHQGH